MCSSFLLQLRSATFKTFLLLFLHLCCRLTISDEGCSSPLGLSSGAILDWQISASSSYPAKWDDGCHMKHARLHASNGRAWCAGRKAAGEWLLVDLGVPAKITGVLTQGKGDDEEWVTKYQISYSLDAYKWYYVKDLYDNKKDFYANLDSHQPRANIIEPEISGRFVRLHVVEWHGHPSLRLELLGCQECKTPLSEGSQVRLSASSSVPWKRKKSCQPYDIQIGSQRAWCARRKAEHEWIQFDLGYPLKVTGLVTKGRGDSRRKHWVKSYIFMYSNDSRVWFTYKDGNHLDKKVFGGNLDKNTERRHYLNSPVNARFVRLSPTSWHKAIAMRAAILGCPHKGECAEGYFRITNYTSCVENLAYKNPTWVNDERHQWTEWDGGGDGSLAVDGSISTTPLERCSVVNNYNSEEPIWMVDLGRRRDVSGVVLHMWHGDGKEQSEYRDYVFGLDHISIYVEKKPRLDPLSSSKRRKCASLSRLNNALFNKKVHLECPQPINGRYVYIKGTGVANRWHRLFSLVLCEIMVY